jgi:predicted molibdopterin-dependent oxidoreductase YjgC
MSCGVPGMEDAGCLFLFGYNPSASHPIVSRRIVKAKEKGAKIIVADPRVIETARIADIYLPLKNGSNIAFLNAFANVIVTEGLVDEEFVKEHTLGFDEWWDTIKEYTPENTQEITGVDPQLLREAARMYATAEPSSILCWGMGVCQHLQNVEAVHACAAIACVSGQIGKPNSGVAPVRGQNNVQGACDMGALPNYFPGYQKVTDPDIRQKFADHWNVPVEALSDHVGYKVSDLPRLIEEGKIRAFYNFGEDPVQTEPDVPHLTKMLEKLDLFVCQDIFMTQTAAMADVVLPATSWGEHEGVFTACDRTFQYFSQAVPPKGECKHDWQIFSELAERMGYDMHWENAQQIWDEECRALWPAAYGATYEKMAGTGHAQWPIPTLDHPGTPDLFLGGKFTTPEGKAHLVAHDYRDPTEMPDEEFPLILCTVREVGHYSCRSMTGNCKVLALLADEPGELRIHPDDAKERGIRDGELVRAWSRRGETMSRAVIDERVNAGTVYMTYQWWIGKCNNLTLHHVDDRSRTPEDKFSACQVEALPDQKWAERHLQELYSQLKEDLAETAAAQHVEPTCEGAE